MSALLWLAGMISVLGVAHLGAMAFTGVLAGRQPSKIHLGLGPVLLRGSLGRTKVELSMFPVCFGYVQWRGSSDHDTAERSADPDNFVNWHPLLRAMPPLQACLVLAAIGIAFGASAESFTATYSEVVQLILHPFSTGAPRMAQFLATLPADPTAGFGVLAIKLSAINLLPLPTLNGFAIVEGVASALTGRQRIVDSETRNGQVIMGIGVIAVTALMWLLIVSLGAALANQLQG